jgi:hypothetical protein
MQDNDLGGVIDWKDKERYVAVFPLVTQANHCQP